MTDAATVRDLLARPFVGAHSLLGGKPGLDQQVTEVRLLAAPDVTAELPAGTLLILGRDALLVESYQAEVLLRHASQTQASGILTAPAERAVPVSTPRLADKLALPLAVVSHPDLLELTQQLALVVKQPAATTLDTLDRLLARLATSTDIDSAVAATSGVLSAEVGLYSRDGKCIAGTGLPELPAGASGSPVAGWEPNDHGGRITLPIRIGASPPIGWLAASLAAWGSEVRNTTHRALQLAAATLAAMLVADSTDGERHARFRTELFTELLQARGALPRRTAERAQAAGWRLDGWHVGIHLVIHPAPDAGELLARSDLLRHALHVEGIAAIVIERTDGYLLWHTSTEQPASSSAGLGTLRRALTAFLDSLPVAEHIAAGVGRPHRGADGIAATLTDAREASQAARPGARGVEVVHFEGVGVKRLLYGWYAGEAFDHLAATTLEPLDDATPDGALLHTLESYLDNRSSIVDTATALDIHRNTVARRLKRIEALLGASLDDPDDRLALQLACRIKRGS